MAFRRQPEPEAKPESATIQFQPVGPPIAGTAAAPKPPAAPTDALQHLSQVADAMRRMTAEIAELRARNVVLEQESQEHARRMAALRDALKLDK